MLTEDIDISWKTQLGFWNIHYEPRALCWILMPETLRGLWRQRLRWSQGGCEVLRKYHKRMMDWKQRRLWPIFIEYGITVLWAYCFFLTMAIYFLGLFFHLPPSMVVHRILPGWTGVILAMACLLQMAVGLSIDSRFEKGIYRVFFWLIWYPMIYWVLNAAVTVIGFPKALIKKKGTIAIWESPDRGW